MGNNKKSVSAKSASATGPTKTSLQVVKQIWPSISVQDWLTVVKTTHPNNHWSATHKSVKGCCPFHDDKSPSFYIHVDKHYAKCFSSDCGRFFYDPVKLYSALTGLVYGAALREMKDRFTLKINNKLVAELNQQFEHREMKRVLAAVINAELCDADASLQAGKPDQALSYAYNTVRYLRQKRNLPDDVLHLCPIGVMPNSLRLQHLLGQYAVNHNCKDYWPEVQSYLDWALMGTEWLGSLVFVTGATPTDPAKFKIRKVPLVTSGVFGTIDKDKDIRYITDDREPGNGFFGLYGAWPYQPFIADVNNPKSVYVTEGEFDAMSIFARQFKTSTINFFIFSGGGSSCQSLDTLLPFAFDRVYVIGDKDKGGDGFEGHALKEAVRMPVRIFNWPPSFALPNIKPDLDEVVCHHGLDLVDTELRKPENFLLPQQWALNHALKEMINTPADDVRYLTSIAARWGGAVRDTSELFSYVQEVVKHHPQLHPGQIQNAINTTDANAEAFIERIKTTLLNRFHVMELKTEGASQILCVWDRQTRQVIHLHVGEKYKLIAALSAHLGKDIYRFIHEDVGDPGFMLSYEDALKEDKYVLMAKTVVDYILFAVERMTENAPVAQTIRKLGAGFHVIAPGIDSRAEKGEFHAYLVTGPTLYRAEYAEDTWRGWTQLSGPSDGHIVIKVDPDDQPNNFMPQIKSVEDLNREPQYSASELYKMVLEMVRYGWDFKDQLVTSELVASLIMLLPIASAGMHQPTMMFTGEAASGKTSLVGGLIGGNAIPRINIVQAALFNDTYSAAGLRQTMNGSSMCLCLDEFEDKGGNNDKKSLVCRAVLAQYRNLTNEGCVAVYGTASGQAQRFVLRHPLILSGIRPLHDVADITRYIIIEMDKKTERQAPQDIILQRFGEEHITAIRHALPLAMFQLAKKYYKAFHEIEVEFQDGADIGPLAQIARTRQGLYCVFALKKILGQDYKAFAREYYKANRARLETIANTSISGDIFNTLMLTPCVQTNDVDDTRPQMLNYILSAGNPEILNTSGSGIFYDRLTNWIVVVWGTVIHTMLKTTSFRDQPPSVLQTQTARHPYAIDKEAAIRSDVLDRLAEYTGGCIRIDQVTVFNVDNRVPDTAKLHKRETATGIEEDLGIAEKYADLKVEFPKPEKKDANGGTSTKVAKGGKKSDDDDWNY